ncbi:MAG: hypothetical protein PHX08_11620 [Lachnospiraceae bacterium]|nr:hypothetical protein [Lachnospiraceae bacterium]
MILGTDQSSSKVGRDQIGGNQYNLNIVEVERNLAVAKNPIRTTELSLEDFVDSNLDENNTVLITKLKDGGFNTCFRNNAKLKKVQALTLMVGMTKTEEGKAIFNDIYSTLLTVINMRYIANMNDGDTLKASLSSILYDLAGIVQKYSEIVNIDESFLEGMLYIATSRCAVKWRIDDADEDDN